MPTEYTDFILSQNDYGTTMQFTNENAIVLAIRNILLSKPGNFPFNPSIGMNIKKYEFDLLDEETVLDIQTELNRQIALYVPELGNVSIYVKIIKDSDEKQYLGISIMSNMFGDDISSNFIIGKENDEIKIFNEIE